MTRLKAMRIEKGLSQNELAAATGINIGTLRHYEIGSKLIDNAKFDTILKCAIALKCPYTKIVENKETIELIYSYINITKI